MKPIWHKVYIGSMVLVLILVTAYLIYSGYSYYNTSLEERFYHPDHELLKPNGLLGSWNRNYRIHLHGGGGIHIYAAKKNEVAGQGGQTTTLA